MKKSKQIGRLNWASGDHANALRAEDAIANSYKSASRTVVAQIQSRIKARRYAAKLVVLVKLSGQQKLPESKNLFPETFTVVRSSLFLI